MFDPFEEHDGALNADQAHELLRDLERNTPEEIRRKRSSFRILIKTSVVLSAGNSSSRMEFKVKGVTGDISEGGCSALFPLAPRVGDIYRLEFDKHKLDLPLTFARCLRCRLIREDAFEAGFAFFKTITLPDTLAAPART